MSFNPEIGNLVRTAFLVTALASTGVSPALAESKTRSYPQCGSERYASNHTVHVTEYPNRPLDPNHPHYNEIDLGPRSGQCGNPQQPDEALSYTALITRTHSKEGYYYASEPMKVTCPPQTTGIHYYNTPESIGNDVAGFAINSAQFTEGSTSFVNYGMVSDKLPESHLRGETLVSCYSPDGVRIPHAVVRWYYITR
jgi:hypothetical protein